MVYEDSAGFITHYKILPRDVQDADVVVEQTRIVQDLHDGQIEDASFDRGFHSAENQERLQQIIEHPCLPKKAPREIEEQKKNASVRFREARQRHPGIESAIGALESGNGLERCRDRTELGLNDTLLWASWVATCTFSESFSSNKRHLIARPLKATASLQPDPST